MIGLDSSEAFVLLERISPIIICPLSAALRLSGVAHR